LNLSDKNIQDKIRENFEYCKEYWPNFQQTISSYALEEEPEILARFADIRSGERVLEIGCGTGGMVEGLSRITLNVVGVDFLQEAVSCTKLKGIPVVQGSGFSLPFKDNSFDCVVCNNWIQNISSELSDILLRELARVTRERIILGDVRNRLAIFLDLGLLIRAIWRRGSVAVPNINAEFYYFWRIAKALPKYGLKAVRLQPSSHFIGLFRRYPWYKRIYRMKPGRIGIVGWLLPLPYGVLHYDILLVKKKGS
jgi:ubiquinone/menaquinone biosynthesis C-methylase UbiE